MFRALTLCVLILVGAATARTDQQAGSAGLPGSSGSSAQSGAYKMDVAALQGGEGIVGLWVTIRDSSNAIVRDFEVIDEKPFHLFVVSRDLRFFRHLFPVVSPDGTLQASAAIPAGELLLVADFMPSGGARQFLRQVVTFGRTSRPDMRDQANAPATAGRGPSASPTGEFDVVTNVKIQPLPFTIPARERTALHVMLSRTEDGRPLVNLEPYLGLGGYLLAVKEDLSEVVAAGAPTTGIPVSLLTFAMTFPTPGRYVVWVEFHRFGEPLAARLELTAR